MIALCLLGIVIMIPVAIIIDRQSTIKHMLLTVTTLTNDDSQNSELIVNVHEF